MREQPLADLDACVFVRSYGKFLLPFLRAYKLVWDAVSFKGTEYPPEPLAEVKHAHNALSGHCRHALHATAHICTVFLHDGAYGESVISLVKRDDVHVLVVDDISEGTGLAGVYMPI